MSNSNDLEVKLRFLTEHLDSIDQGVKSLEGLKTEALSTGNVLKTVFSVQLIQESMHKVIEVFGEVKESIKFGAELENLSARTGETVANLVVLQQAFKNAGVDAGGVGMVINKLQKAMTGVNEQGEPTAKAFDALGVSVEELKTMSAIDQITTLQKAFSGLPNAADRARASMEMFGRGGGEMLALLSKSDSMDIAKQQVGSLGETMEKNAEKFHELEDSWNAIGVRMQQLFAGIAEKVAPLLQHIADEANKIDLTELGKEIGDLILSLTELIKIAAPIAVVLGSQFLLEATLARMSKFTGEIAKSATALSAETVALQANTAAQAANSAARAMPGVAAPSGTPGAMRPFAPGFETVGGEIKTAGAPFSKEVYDLNRKSGMTAEAALASAREAMHNATLEGQKYLKETAMAAEKAVPAWKRLASGIGEVSGKVGAFVGSLGSIQGMLAAMAAEQGVQAASNAVGNYLAGNTIGERTNSADMAASSRLLDEKNKQQGEIADRVKNVSTQEEKQALAAEITAIIEKDAAQARDKGTAANPRGAQNQVLEQSNQAFTRLSAILAGKSGLSTNADVDHDRQLAESRAKVEAQAKSDADLKAQLAQNQKEAEFAALPTNKKLDSVRDQISEEQPKTQSGTDEEKAASIAKIVELDKQRIALEKELADWTAAEADRKKDEADLAEKTTAELKQSVQIEEMRAAGKGKVADRMQFELQLQKELDALREKGVADEDTLNKYASQKRDAFTVAQESKSGELDDETSLQEAKAKGDDKEVKRLEWLKEYNRLKDEGYREDQAQRAANAASAEGPDNDKGTKPGEIDKESGIRRGRDQSDLSWAMRKADDNIGGQGGSLLDAYNENRKTAVGAVGGQSILADRAGDVKGLDGTEKSGQGATDTKAAADALAKQTSELNSAAAALATAGKSLSGDGIAALKKAVADLTAQVEALKNKT